MGKRWTRKFSLGAGNWKWKKCFVLEKVSLEDFASKKAEELCRWKSGFWCGQVNEKVWIKFEKRSVFDMKICHQPVANLIAKVVDMMSWKHISRLCGTTGNFSITRPVSVVPESHQLWFTLFTMMNAADLFPSDRLQPFFSENSSPFPQLIWCPFVLASLFRSDSFGIKI